MVRRKVANLSTLVDLRSHAASIGGVDDGKSCSRDLGIPRDVPRRIGECSVFNPSRIREGTDSSYSTGTPLAAGIFIAEPFTITATFLAGVALSNWLQQQF